MALLQMATGMYNAVLIRKIRETQKVPTAPFLKNDLSMQPLRITIEKCLFGANRRVVEQAVQWGMNFMAVSDLNGSTVRYIL
jgi:hypothetical protein